jgi:hypothetical protein
LGHGQRQGRPMLRDRVTLTVIAVEAIIVAGLVAVFWFL